MRSKAQITWTIAIIMGIIWVLILILWTVSEINHDKLQLKNEYARYEALSNKVDSLDLRILAVEVKIYKIKVYKAEFE